MIRAVIGRRCILLFILMGFILSFCILTWVGRGGAISYQSAAPVIKKLLAHYLPLLAILAGFYFSERATKEEGASTTIETFVFALTVVLLWAFGPSALIALSDTIEGAMRILDSFAVIGTSLTSASIAFYFSKSGKSRRG